MPARDIRDSSVVITLDYSGLTNDGNREDDTRDIVGCSVSNGKSISVLVEIESETTKELFQATCRAGQVTTIETKPITQHWRAIMPNGSSTWDGLNIRVSDVTTDRG